jgi:uncharacterized protein (DUF2236 family)
MARWPVRRKNDSPQGPIAQELAADWRLLLMVGTGLLIQVSHPVIGGGVGQYSSYRTDPYGRFDRSVWPVLAMVLMEEGADDYGRDLRAMHRGIQGTDHVGRRFHAWDPEGAFLVLASAAYVSEQVADVFGRALDDEQRAQVFLAWRAAARRFGIPERSLPDDLAGYRAWLDHVVSERLEAHPTAVELLGTIRRPPAPPRVPHLLWWPIGSLVVGPLATLVTLGTLPPKLRETLGLSWTRRDQVTLRVFALVVRAMNAVMPRRLRKLTAEIVRRRGADFRAYAAHGAELGIAPSIANEGCPERAAQPA